MTPDAKVFYELWQSTERELASVRLERFEEIIKSLNYDGKDTNSLTVGEIRRAISKQSSGPTGSPSALDSSRVWSSTPWSTFREASEAK